MECLTCFHRGFREMIKQPYGYAGEIPCLTCSRFCFVEDKYEPIVEKKELNDGAIH